MQNFAMLNKNKLLGVRSVELDLEFRLLVSPVAALELMLFLRLANKRNIPTAKVRECFLLTSGCSVYWQQLNPKYCL